MGGMDVIAHQGAYGVYQFTVYHVIYGERGEWSFINSFGRIGISTMKSDAGAVIEGIFRGFSHWVRGRVGVKGLEAENQRDQGR